MGWWGFEGYHFNRVTCARREGMNTNRVKNASISMKDASRGHHCIMKLSRRSMRSMYRRLPTRLARRMNAEKRAKFADRVPRRRADSGLSRKVCRCLCAGSCFLPFPSVGNVLSSCILLPSVSLAMCSLVTEPAISYSSLNKDLLHSVSLRGDAWSHSAGTD